MTVKFTRPSINIRETLDQLNKPSGIAGNAMLAAETPQEQFNLIGAGRKNLIINGGFDVWQRGTTGSVVGGPEYASADRWKLYVNTSTTMTLSRQTFSPGQTEVPGNPKYYAKFDWLGTGSSQFFGFEQFIEGCHHAAGGYLTVSFYARTEQADDITLGVNQVFGSGGSASVTVGNFPIDTETTWKKFVVTTQVPSIAGKTIGAKDALAFTFYRNGTLNSYLEIANVQVEVGSVATPFEHRSYGEELALCQRYYQMYYGYSYQVIGGFTGTMETTTTCHFFGNIPEMRGAPTLEENNLHVSTASGSVFGVTSSSLPSTSKNGFRLVANINTSVAANTFMFLRSPGSSAYIAFNAEL